MKPLIWLSLLTAAVRTAARLKQLKKSRLVVGISSCRYTSLTSNYFSEGF